MPEQQATAVAPPAARAAIWPTHRTRSVSRLISAFFDRHEAEAAAYGRDFSALWAQLRHATDGGKKMRPDLVLIAHRELGGDHDEAAIAAAAAFELLHTAFLIHDDVIDGDTVRRGGANLIGSWSLEARSIGIADSAAKTWGEAAGILAGDLMIHFAHGLIARLDVEADVRSLLLDIFDEAMMITAAGELDDVGLSVGMQTPTMTTVLAMTARKTAHYSFRGPLKAGATLAGVDAGVIALLDDYGENTGIAFQLRDDLLGMFGSPTATGKSVVSDLRRAAMTPLMAYALRTPCRDELLELLDATSGDVGADRVRRLLIESGARDFVNDLIERHVGQAMATARSTHLPRALGEYLADVSAAAAQRTW